VLLGGGGATALAENAAAPAALVGTTVQAVLAGGVSPSAAVLAGGVLRAMFVKKATMVATVVVALGLVGGGLGLLRQPAPAALGGGGEEEPKKAKPGVIFTLPEEPKKEPDDLRKLQGAWQAVALEHNGEKLSAEAANKFRVIIRDNTITFDSDGNRREASFMLGTNYRPKAIWLKTAARAPTVRGIYALESDRLKICLDNDEGKTVAGDFVTKAGSGLTLMVLERAPDGKTVKGPSEVKEKRYAFSMQNKNWTQVFEWFSDVTGLAYSSPFKPTGTFTFTPPKGKQEYTISEIVDIINEALMSDPPGPGYSLVRRTKTFALVPMDRPIDGSQVATTSLEDLPRYGRTEFVKVSVRLRARRAEDAALIARTLMTKFGQVTTDEGSNTVFLLGMAGTLREVVKALQVSDDMARDEPTPEERERPGAAKGPGETDKPRQTLTGSESPVRAVAFSADGRSVLGATEGGRVSIWDAATGKVRNALRDEGLRYLAMAISPDGKRILVGGTTDAAGGKGKDGKTVAAGWVALYSTSLNELVWHVSDISPVRALAFSPDGKSVSVGCADGTIRVQDAATGKLLVTCGGGQNAEVSAVAFSPDGKVIAGSSADTSVTLWDSRAGRELRVLREHHRPVTSVAFSPDGRLLLVACGDCAVDLWEVATGKKVRDWVAATKGVHSVAFSPDGKCVATGAVAGPVGLWDVATGKELASYRGHTKAVNGLAFSPDGKAIASGSADGTVKVWDVGR
jgi:uncharacterized protein (TIGR03067 family)